tara:strand:- start:402 stop:1511 length:1110 start_codon:yes stop_codon:yes gene_type:complete
MNKIYFNNLDVYRGIAALLVFIMHLRSVYFKDYNHIENANFLVDFFYFITSLGHAAVMIFFVISGFVITNLIFKNWSKFSFSKYIVNRLVRLWVVLIPSIIFTLIVYYFFSIYFPEINKGSYNDVINSGPTIENNQISIIQIIGNIFFLQEILVETFSLNGPLWSLSYEFWYYILFPLLLFNIEIFKNNADRNKIFYYFILLLLVLLLIPYKILLYFIIWLLGSLVYYLRNVHIKYLKTNIILSLIIFFLSLVNYKFNFFKLENFYIDFIISVGFSYFLLVTLNLKIRIFKFKIFNKLSKISYSLYLFHFPMTLIVFTLIQTNKNIFNLMNLIYFSLICFLIILIVNLFWFIFEKNTYFIRNKITKFLK